MPISLFFLSLLSALSGLLPPMDESITIQTALWHTYTAEQAAADLAVDQSIGRQLSRLTPLTPVGGSKWVEDPIRLFDNYSLRDGESIYAFTDHLRVKSRRGDLTTTLSFRAQGVNQLMQISSITMETKSSKKNYQATTDWIGPYIVSSKSEDRNETKGRFTGGWHGSHGDGSGQPTAQTKSITLYADKEPLKDIQIGFSKEIALCVINDVYGYNSNQPVLEETIWYTFRESGFEVQTTVRPLIPITIERYYGLQTQNRLFNKSVSYVYGDGQMVKAAIDTDSQSEVGKGLSYLEFCAEDSAFKMRVILDAVYHNEKPFKLDATRPAAFTKSYGKTYYNLINGEPLFLDTQDRFQWMGTYTFLLNE